MARYIQATCELQAERLEIGGTTGVAGRMLLYGEPGKEITINGKITGLTECLHGFSIHDSSDIGGGCTNAGQIFHPLVPNVDRTAEPPERPNHGRPENDIDNRLVGALGNIEADAEGISHISIEDNQPK